MEQRICTDNNPLGTKIILPSVIWASHTLPSALTPSFAICNIKRDYQLEVRLGFRMGLSKVHHQDPNRRQITRALISVNANISRNFQLKIAIREFQFPVYVTAVEASKANLQ